MNSPQHLFRLYILRCADGTLFATASDEPGPAVVARYNAGHGAPFTKGRLPVSLAFDCDVSADRHDAIGAVCEVRQLSRSAKERLCGGCHDLIKKVLAGGRRLGAKLRRVPPPPAFPTFGDDDHGERWPPARR